MQEECEQMLVDHIAAAKRADAREKAYEEYLTGTNELPVAMTVRFCNMEVREEAMLRRLAAVEEAQDFTANRLGELVAHEHMEAEDRLAGVEKAQAAMAMQLVNVACHRQTALDTKALLDSMRRRLDATEARLARYAMRLAESAVNLQDCMDRIVAMEKMH